ncbi:GntR family transcriptional regulator [soil metagenome]
MRPLRRHSDLAAQATEQIRAAILRGDLCPGSRVRQEELAAMLSVSRAPVREALVILQGEGLVQTNGSRGLIVTPLDPQVVQDLYGFREPIERHVAEALARRQDVMWEALYDILAAGRRAAPTDVPALIQLDVRFHTFLYDAVGNRILSEVMRGQWINMRRALGATLTVPGYSRRIWDEHTAILEAIAAHDPARAGRLAAAHTAAASQRLLESLRQASEMPTPGTDRQHKTRVG